MGNQWKNFVGDLNIIVVRKLKLIFSVSGFGCNVEDDEEEEEREVQLGKSGYKQCQFSPLLLVDLDWRPFLNARPSQVQTPHPVLSFFRLRECPFFLLKEKMGASLGDQGYVELTVISWESLVPSSKCLKIVFFSFIFPYYFLILFFSDFWFRSPFIANKFPFRVG